MAVHQTSIISTTAPPAPAFVTNVEVDPVVSTTPVAFTIPPFSCLNQYPLTITSSLALSARVSSQMSPRQFHCAHVTANRHVTVAILSLLTRSDLASLSRISAPCSLGFPFAHSSVVCSFSSLLGKLSFSRFGSQNRLFCIPSSRAIATFCVSCSSTSRTPKNRS